MWSLWLTSPLSARSTKMRCLESPSPSLRARHSTDVPPRPPTTPLPPLHLPPLSNPHSLFFADQGHADQNQPAERVEPQPLAAISTAASLAVLREQSSLKDLKKPKKPRLPQEHKPTLRQRMLMWRVRKGVQQRSVQREHVTATHAITLSERLLQSRDFRRCDHVLPSDCRRCDHTIDFSSRDRASSRGRLCVISHG